MLFVLVIRILKFYIYVIIESFYIFILIKVCWKLKFLIDINLYKILDVFKFLIISILRN